MASCGLIWRYWQMLGYAGDQFTCMGCGAATVRGGSWSAGSVNACVRRAGLLEAGLRAA